MFAPVVALNFLFSNSRFPVLFPRFDRTGLFSLLLIEAFPTMENRENVVEEDRERWRAGKSNSATLLTSYLVDGARVKRFNVNFQPVIFALGSR